MRVVLSMSRVLRRLPGRNVAAAFFFNRSGATAIEFAMIAVPFIGLIASVFETGAVYFRTAQLQLTTETASRGVLTRSYASGMTYDSFINNYVCTWKSGGTVKSGTLSKMFDCDKILMKIDSPTAWNNSTFDTTNSFYASAPARSSTIALPAAGQIAIVRIVYPMAAMTSIITGGAFKGQTIKASRAGQIQYSGKWTHILLGVYAFRVEP